jgi:phosphatidylserine/phosphatidylglycerophosphate/cardiolipin synthase-like enzyme
MNLLWLNDGHEGGERLFSGVLKPKNNKKRRPLHQRFFIPAIWLAGNFCVCYNFQQHLIYRGGLIVKRTILVSVLVLSLTGCSVAAKGNAVQHPSTTSQPAAANDQIQYAFTQADQHPEKMLVDVIDSAKSSLDIAIYSLTQKDIVAAILNAKKRGVAARIITDHQEAQNKSQAEALKKLKAAGIPIKQNKHSGLMHLKVTIADKSVLTTGSFNYTAAASTTNDEVLMVVHDAKMATEWDAQFERMWADTKGFDNL